MRRIALLLLALCVAGCSTAPIAGTLDHFFPAKMLPSSGNYHGGVSNSSLPIAPPSSDQRILPPRSDLSFSELP